jgi:hypothetical protein
MIKVTEIMINEDGETSINALQFGSVSELTQYEYFGALMAQGGVAEMTDDELWIDNFGEPLPNDKVEEFKRLIQGKKGVLYSWSVEYDHSIWFFEIDPVHNDELLALSSTGISDGDEEEEYVHDCSILKNIVEECLKSVS